MKEGRFREDLYYRLNVVELVTPPLRERKEDIEHLAKRMLTFFGSHNHRCFLGFTAEAMAILKNYGWPGNVRELRNTVERMAIFAKQSGWAQNTCQENSKNIQIYLAWEPM